MHLNFLHRPGMRPGGFRLLNIGVICLILFLFPGVALCRIYIDVNAPSIPKFNIAFPDFTQVGSTKDRSDLSTELPGIISSDLEFSGYFNPMDKAAFLEEKGAGFNASIQFKDWSVIGAELLLKGQYTCIGNQLEVEVKLFDVFWGRQILGKRALGDVERRRHLMHRLSNEIILQLTGHEGIFLTKLAFVGNSTGKREIYTSDYDGHDVRQVTNDKSIALLPRWSPDGKYLAFGSYKQGGPMLYLKDMSSGAVRRLSGESGLNIGASWAPSGREIALTMSHKGNPDIFTINLQGKILQQLVQNYGIDVSPAFSPQGDKIAFVSNRSGSPQIYILNLNTRTEERLTYEGRYNTSPAWSSRDRIAFVSMSNGNFDICTVDAAGGGSRKLTNGTGNNEEPCWSPDGRYIMFTSDREGSYHLYIMNANGQNQRRVTSMKGDQTAPSWAPE
jgi:TolB protein